MERKELIRKILKEDIILNNLLEYGGIWSLNPDPKILSREKNEPVDLSKIKINDDNKLRLRPSENNQIYIGEKLVGWFGVEKIGDIILKDKKYKNSILFGGGFSILHFGVGIGTAVIKKIFKDNPTIENILLYVSVPQGSLDFWLKLGGEVIFEEGTIKIIKLNRNKII